jgi:hypothetical protein
MSVRRIDRSLVGELVRALSEMSATRGQNSVGILGCHGWAASRPSGQEFQNRERVGQNTRDTTVGASCGASPAMRVCGWARVARRCPHAPLTHVGIFC